MLFVINKEDMDKSIVRFTWIEPHITHGIDNTITMNMLDLEVSYKMFFLTRCTATPLGGREGARAGRGEECWTKVK